MDEYSLVTLSEFSSRGTRASISDGLRGARMTEEQVTVGVFHDYAPAREAANCLNAAGIPNCITGEASCTAGAGFAPTVVTLWLQVPESYVEQACALLEQDAQTEEVEEDVPPEFEEEEDEVEEENEHSRGPVKKLLGDAVGVFLDGPLRSLNSTQPNAQPDATPPRTVWAAVWILLAILLLTVPILLEVLK